MRNIKIIRKNEWINKLWSYDVCIGNNPFIKIKNGEEKTVPLHPEDKTVAIKYSWVSSNTILLNDNATQQIEIGVRPLFKSIIPITLISIILRYLKLNQYLDQYQLPIIIFYSLFLLIPIYFFTVGRKKYFTIKYS